MDDADYFAHPDIFLREGTDHSVIDLLRSTEMVDRPSLKSHTTMLSEEHR